MNDLKDKKRFIFISPHLDDAVFSAGGLMSQLSEKGSEIILINVFTKASNPPYTLSVKRFLSSCGYDSVDKLFEDRITEDASVAKQINAKVINLGFTDALWRQKKGAHSKIAELNYVYPIFRFTIERGFISHHDKPLIKELENLLKQKITENEDTVIFCPLGIGLHTDHLIVRQAVSASFNNVVFWEDYPYSEVALPDPVFIKSHGLISEKIRINREVKEKLVNGYKSQIKAIFRSSRATVKNNETYYYNHSRDFYPKRLGNFTFADTFMKQERSGLYSLAIYKDPKGKKVIVKRWSGKNKDLSYRWLKNEINVYRLLGRNSHNFCTPELLKVVETKDKLYMIIELLEGKDLSMSSTKEKVAAFSEVLLFLQKIDISDQKRKIALRGPLFWFLILPYASTKAIIKHPNKFIPILKSAMFAFLASPFILARRQRTLIHRDLNDTNVFKKGDRVCVLDFELASIADPLIDWAILLLKYSNDKEFTSILKKTKEFKKTIKDKKTLFALAAYVIIFAIYDLTFELGLHGLDLDFLNQVMGLGVIP